MSSGKTYYWVPSETEVWLAAELDPSSSTNSSQLCSFLPVNKAISKALRAYIKDCILIDDPNMLWEIPDDFISLASVNESAILYTARKRFREKLIYTSCGSVLMSLNPFERIPNLYGTELMAEYVDPLRDDLKAHVYLIPSRAYQQMKAFGKNQALLISGESGAGKTEAAKQCLNFIANIAGASVEPSTRNRRGSQLVGTKDAAKDIANRVISASPILESFGNAQTLRNPNSSRFGKWMELDFDKADQICGSNVISYLLEKSRVSKVTPGERNYHVFYQLLRGLSSEELTEMKLSSSSLSYRYLTSVGMTTEAPDFDDSLHHSEMMNAFANMGLGHDETQEFLKYVAAVLLLGNIEFDSVDDGEASSVSGSGGIDAAALLSVPSEILRIGLCQKTLKTGAARGSLVIQNLSPQRAADFRDSLSRAIYDKMFAYIIKRINDQNQISSVDCKKIGLLDIFGFEIFEDNSFEQLCINYCNEMLQNHFNFVIFEAEKKLYDDEKIQCDTIEFRDNSPVIQDIELTFKNLDEEARIPKGSSKTWFDKMIGKITQKSGSGSSSASFTNITIPTKRDCFMINHYAGKVSYLPNMFMEKNQEQLSEDLIDMMCASDSAVMKAIFTTNNSNDKEDTTKRSSSTSRNKSISYTFTSQLNSLLTMLRASESHFIRCIKSNDACKAMVFDSQLVQRQLIYSGIFEVIKIQQSGLPFRLHHQEFYIRYSPLLATSIRYNFKEDADGMVNELKAKYNLQSIQKGVSRVFYKSDEYRTLEKARNDILNRWV